MPHHPIANWPSTEERGCTQHFTDYTYHLCDDYLRACVPGDVVRIAAGYPTTAQKSHIVDALVSPMHTGTERVQPEGVEGWLRRRQEKRRRKLLRLPGVEEVDNPVLVPQSETEEKLPGVEEADNPVLAPQNEAEEKLLGVEGDENPVLVPQRETEKLPGVEEADNPVLAPQDEVEEKLLGFEGGENPVLVPQNETEEKLPRLSGVAEADNPVLLPQGETEAKMLAAQKLPGSKAWGIFGEVLLGKRVGVRVREDGRRLANGSRAGPAVVPAGMWKGLWKGLEQRKKLQAANKAANMVRAEKEGQVFDEQQWEEDWRNRKRKKRVVTAVKEGKIKGSKKEKKHPA